MFFFFFIGYLSESTGVHRDWNLMGCNKNFVMRMEVFLTFMQA